MAPPISVPPAAARRFEPVVYALPWYKELPSAAAVGLHPNPAKFVACFIVPSGGSEGNVYHFEPYEIVLRSNVHRRNVYDTVNRLIEKGLVSRVFRKDEHRFRAVNPDKLREMLQAQERQLELAMPSLKASFSSDRVPEAAYIYKGREGYKNYLRDMINAAEDTYFLGAKGLWYTPWVDKHYLEEYKAAMKRAGKSYFTLYDPRVPQELPQALENVGGEYKVLPKEYAAPGITDVFGDYVVTFTSVGIGDFGEDGTIFVMVNPELAETYRTWFRAIWGSLPSS